MLMTSGWLRWMRNEDEDGVSLSEAVVVEERSLALAERVDANDERMVAVDEK